MALFEVTKEGFHKYMIYLHVTITDIDRMKNGHPVMYPPSSISSGTWKARLRRVLRLNLVPVLCG